MRTKLVTLLLAFTVTCAIMVYALDLRRSPTYAFTSSVDVPITTVFKGYPFKLDSIVMSFATPQTAVFQVQLKRGSEPFKTIYAASNTFTTVTWILEGTFMATTNDTLRFTNNVAAPAEVFFNYQI